MNDPASLSRINYFVIAKHSTTINPFLEHWSKRTSEFLKVVPYEDIDSIDDSRKDIDIDRIDDRTRWKAMDLGDSILGKHGRQHVLNHPRLGLLRFELLDLLWKKGINDFRVYAPYAVDDMCRFPVFLRRANDHKGPASDLIYSRRDYRRTLRSLAKNVGPLKNLIAIEYCDTLSPDGVYRKYSSFRVGRRIVPGHVVFSDDWVAKQNAAIAPRDEERAYLEGNPHQAELMEIFDLAGIEYGRIDYGLRNGRIQVWEINTNPIVIADPGKLHPCMRSQKARLARNLEEGFRSLFDACRKPSSGTERS